MHTTRHRLIALLGALAALALAAGLMAPAQAATTVRLTGTIIDPGGFPVTGADVELSYGVGDQGGGGTVGAVRSDARGRYTFAKVPADAARRYTLEVVDRSGAHVQVNTPTFSITKATTRSVTMPDAGIIQGRITTRRGDAPAVAASNVDVQAYADVDGLGGDARTTPGGRFRIGGLTPATYRISFNDGNDAFKPTCYDDVAQERGECPDTATTVTVRAGETTTLDPQVLDDPYALVTGTVRTSAGKPIPGAQVAAYDGDPAQDEAVTTDVADASGRFELKPLRAGTVRVQVRASGYATRWYRSAKTYGTATRITLTDGQQLDGIVVTLPRS